MLQSRPASEINNNPPENTKQEQQDNMGSYIPIEEIGEEIKIDPSVPLIGNSQKIDLIKDQSKEKEPIKEPIKDKSQDKSQDQTKEQKDPSKPTIKEPSKDIDFIIKYSIKDKNYILNTPDDNLIGSFNVFQLMKFVGSHISPNFMKDTDMTQSNEIIKKYVVKYDNTIILTSYLDSPFMRDINVLISLCNNLCIYEKQYLSDYLAKEDPKIKTKLYNILEDFIYMFYNHTLSIISFVINNTLLSNKYSENTCINIDLLKFSSMLTHK